MIGFHSSNVKSSPDFPVFKSDPSTKSQFPTSFTFCKSLGCLCWSKLCTFLEKGLMLCLDAWYFTELTSALFNIFNLFRSSYGIAQWWQQHLWLWSHGFLSNELFQRQIPSIMYATVGVLFCLFALSINARWCVCVTKLRSSILIAYNIQNYNKLEATYS